MELYYRLYMDCKFSTCAYYSLLTFLATITTVFVIYIIAIMYNRSYLEKYHSADLIRWREQELSKLG